MTREEKALLVIDALCEDECLRINHDLSNHPKSCFPCLVYRIAHSASKSCLNKHEEWKKETAELYGHFAESNVKKGGVNQLPKSPRPNITPIGQGTRHHA